MMAFSLRKHPHERGEDRTLSTLCRLLVETPPRAWGRPVLLPFDDVAGGNTPTSVGKTEILCRQITVDRKHPHERGEDQTDSTSCTVQTETPPRAWGRRQNFRNNRERFGNTPTSVGKTLGLLSSEGPVEKHPHERGEDAFASWTRHRIPETPPRAWGRRRYLVDKLRQMRNTPTSVGKTISLASCIRLPWKHPHERGEDSPFIPVSCTPVETPPRAWGRRRNSV